MLADPLYYFYYIERISLEQLGIDGQKYEPTRQMQGKFLTTLDICLNLSNKNPVKSSN